MARKSKNRTRAASGALAIAENHQVQAADWGTARGPYLIWSGYEAANNSPARGKLWWPTSDSRRELNPLARDEIRRRIHWLVANFGFPRRLVFGMAKLVGTLSPQADTEDEDWNEEAHWAFEEHARSSELFDVAGKFDFWSAQRQLSRCFYKDGDHLTALTEGPGGGAQFAFYESHQIKNRAIAPVPGSQNFEDGVLVDRFGKHIRYSLRDAEDPNQWAELDARNCIYYGNYETHGQLRGVPILAAAVTNMHDVVETRGFTKHAIKAQSRMGTVVEQDMGSVVAMPGGGFAGGILSTQVKDNEGKDQTINWETVMSGAATPALRPGQRVKVVTDDRPSFNTMEFEKLLRDCTWTCDLPYESMCDIAGLTGPAVRYVMGDIQR